MRAVGVGLAVAACLVAASGCKSGARPQVEKVALDSLEGLDVLGMTRAQVQESIEGALDHARFERLPEGAPAASGSRPWRLIFSVRAEEPDAEQADRLVVAVSVSLHQKGGSESWESRARGEGRAKSGLVEDVQAASREALGQAVRRAVEDGGALATASGLDEAALVALAGGADLVKREAAAQVLARRGNRAALPVLKGRLQATDDEDVLRAVGLLVELKDPSVVPAIIDAARGRKPAVQQAVVFALAEIGGEDAEAYLFTLAQGHEDPVIRASAERALEQLTHRPRRTPAAGDKP